MVIELGPPLPYDLDGRLMKGYRNLKHLFGIRETMQVEEIESHKPSGLEDSISRIKLYTHRALFDRGKFCWVNEQI